jgi:hypothetical protein
MSSSQGQGNNVVAYQGQGITSFGDDLVLTKVVQDDETHSDSDFIGSDNETMRLKMVMMIYFLTMWTYM